MTIKQETRPYEILVRFNADGTIGAHRKTITEISSEAEIISARENDPEPLATAEGSDLELLSEVIGQANVSVLARCELLQQQNSQLASEAENAKEQAQNASATIEDQARTMAELERQIAGYRAAVNESAS